MKPVDIPISTLSKLNEYAIPSAPALANTLLKAIDTTQAKNKPKNPPSTDAAAEVNTPSVNASERISERFNPIALRIASSILRDSASIIMIVNTSKSPAPIVNDPNTRNIAERAPAPSSAVARAFCLAATTFKFMDSTPDTESNHCKIAVWLPLLITRMLRSPSADAARASPSLRLMKPIMIDSNSSKPGASIEVILPSICKIWASESP